MRILSVDDNNANLYFMQALLVSHGHQVVSVHNGVEALRALENVPTETTRETGFDLIVSDVLMPEMDGFRLCREVKTRERFKRIPFVIYTATYTSRQDEEFGLSLGASRFVVKPIDPEELIAIIEDLHQSQTEGEKPGLEAAPEEDYLRVYNQRLVKKLERKLEQLEEASRDLKRLVAERDREIAIRRAAEDELRRSEEQLRMVWENSLDGMILTRADGTIVRANPAFARMCGIPLQQLEQTHLRDSGWIAPEKAFAEYQQGHGLNTGEGGFEQYLERADRSRVLLQGTATPFELAGASVTLGVFRDITARRRAQEEQAILEAQLAEARKMESVGRLAGGVAHDFNNLLTVIKGYCDLLRLALLPGSEHYAIVEQIEHAGKRAADLTSQLLAFSRRQKVVDAPVSLNKVVTEGLPMLQRLVGEHIEVVTRLDPALDLVMGDTGQFLQVILNLTANARDAMPEGGTLILTTTNIPAGTSLVANSGPMVLLSVSDTGTGIAESAIPHIFDPFFTTKDKEGTGLGLFTVSGIVQRNGGSISVRRSSNSGTVFDILLPSVMSGSVSSSREQPEDPLVARTGDAVVGGTETILVTEDRDEVRELVVATLRRAGYTVLEASSGKGALAIAARHSGPIDLLLTDVLMPEMSGRQLAAQLKSARASLRVLFMSGILGPPEPLEDPAVAVSFPGDYIMKPFGAQTLTKRVRELLDRKESRLWARS